MRAVGSLGGGHGRVFPIISGRDGLQLFFLDASARVW